MPRVLGRVRESLCGAWLLLGLSMLLFVGLEGALRLVEWGSGQRARARTTASDARAEADTYTDPQVARAYWEEFRRSDTAQWTPYAYWRRLPFRGQHINIDADGLRRTTAVVHAALPGTPVSIFMFGGSTVWGTGTPDASTIPSLVQQRLAALGIAATVRNFGESGYVNTQEVTVLLRELQQGRTPDVVVFYDGVNDAFSAWQQGRAGIPMNEFNRVAEFNLSQPGAAGRRLRLDLRDLSLRLATMRAARRLVAAVRLVTGPPPATASSSVDSTVIAAIVRAYRTNGAVVRALGAQFGFRVHFYWQPTSFNKPFLTTFERRQQENFRDFGRFHGRVTDVLRHELGYPGADQFVSDLSEAFRDVREPLFVDWCHLGPAGNAIIADRIADRIVDDLRPELGRTGRPR